MVFVRNNNKLNNNIGVLVCVIVLLVILLVNFDKCFAPIANYFKLNNDISNKEELTSDKEGFNVVSKPVILTERNVRVNPEEKTVTIKFEKPNPNSDDGYILVLSKYNNNLEKVGNLDIKMSDATINKDNNTNTNTNESVNNNDALMEHKYEAICNSSNICEYTFTNVEDKDNEGNLFYYRLGVGIITKDGETENIGKIYEFKFGYGSNQQRFFRIDNTLQEQRALLDKLVNLEKVRAAESAKSVQELSEEQKKDENGKTMCDVDAYMKMLKPYIGNYPDEFILNQQKLDELSLGKYLNKSLALGEINIDVDIADLTPNELNNN